jgi:hypothetical protein
MITMSCPSSLEKAAVASTVTLAAEGSLHPLTLAAVYEDWRTQEWVNGLCDRVNQLVGSDALQVSAWSVSQLSDPEIQQEAISAATQADVIVVSIHAARVFPVNFYSWVDGWAAERRQREGALIGLVGVSRESHTSDEPQEYLRVIARLAGLEFLLREQTVAEAA